MIFESIITFLFAPVYLFVSVVSFALPILNLPQELTVGFGTLFAYINWLFPLSAILPLILFKIAIGIFNITWKTALRLKSFIPTMGN